MRSEMRDVETATPAGALPSLRFDADDYRPTERFDAMNEVYRGLFNCRRVSGGDDGGDGQNPTLRLQAWSLGAIAASSFEFENFTKQPTRRMDPQQSEMLIFSLLRSGQFNAECGDARVLVRPGRVNLGEARYTLHRTEAATGIALRMPSERVGYDRRRHPRIMSLGTGAGTVRLIKMVMQSLFDALPVMTRSEAKNAEPTLIALFRGLLSSGRFDDEAHAAMQAARNVAMKHYILTHLRDEDLDVERLQAVFGASRATVYRAFGEVGGVDRFIRDQRLEAAYDALSDALPKRGAVRMIAGEFGFWDQGAFCRAFRKRHGVRPGDVLGASRLSDESASRVATTPSRLGVVSLASFWSASGVGEPNAKAA
ncbi:MAG: AraC family transcriptional regulator [Pseudomonadota bacterium]